MYKFLKDIALMKSSSLYCKRKIIQTFRIGEKIVWNYELQIRYRQTENIYGYSENGKVTGLLTLQTTVHQKYLEYIH